MTPRAGDNEPSAVGPAGRRPGGTAIGRAGPAVRRRRYGAVQEYLGMLAVLAGLIAVFSYLSPRFFTPLTFQMIAGQVPGAVIIAVGMTYVLIIAGIDLSVGSVLALSSGVLGVCIVKLSLPVPVAVLACLGVGPVCGLLNGFVSNRWRLPSFIVTLGMLQIARGATQLVTDSKTQYIGAPIEPIAAATVVGIPVPFLIAFAIVIAAQVVLSTTVFGRYMRAVGTNEEAVRLSGINPRPIKLAVFAICGLLTSVAAVLHTSRLSSADPNTGSGFELDAIAAVVIGGTSLMGGRGSVVRSFFGVLIIAVLGAGLVVVDVGDPTKKVITGGVIVAAVILDYYRRRLKRGRA